jgi:uncharacterized protein YoxC
MPPMFAAEMSASDLAAVIVAIASVVAVILLIFVVVAINRTLTEMRMSIEQLRRETLPVVDELHRTVVAANAELQRLDGLLESASSVTATVDSASHLAYLAFSNPLIKAIAFAAGTSKAARALRRGS